MVNTGETACNQEAALGRPWPSIDSDYGKILPVKVRLASSMADGITVPNQRSGGQATIIDHLIDYTTCGA